MSSDEARRQALIRFGGVEQVRERTRDEFRAGPIEHLARDIRYGLRSLRRHPGFSARAVLSLAIGIGANATIFGVAHAVLLRESPLDHPETLVNIYEPDAGRGFNPMSHPNIELRSCSAPQHGSQPICPRGAPAASTRWPRCAATDAPARFCRSRPAARVELESRFWEVSMRSAATRRMIGGVAVVMLWGLIAEVQAQFGVGTTWVRTDAQGKGITLKVEACCKGGLRLVYEIPPMNNQPAMTLTIDSPMDGTEAPAMVAGQPSGQVMAAKRVDDHHYTATIKMNGQVFSTSTGTVAPDSKTMTVETVSLAGKNTETWVRK